MRGVEILGKLEKQNSFVDNFFSGSKNLGNEMYLNQIFVNFGEIMHSAKHCIRKMWHSARSLIGKWFSSKCRAAISSPLIYKK